MTGLVLDASALTDLLSGADQEAIVDAIADRSLLAPAHIDAEVLSALRGLMLSGALSQARVRDSLIDLADLPLERWSLAGPLLRRALDLAANITSYDALYVALAEGTGVPLLTRDVRLAKAAERLIDVELI